jgi:hypothetical protein
MKQFSMPKLAIVLWFLNYSLFSLISYVYGNGRHEIFPFVIYASAWVVVELVCLGLIEDVM